MLKCEQIPDDIFASKSARSGTPKIERSPLYRDEYVLQEIEDWLSRRILEGEMRMREIPHVLRTTMPSLYTDAFRCDRVMGERRYVQDMNLLSFDLLTVGLETFAGMILLDNLATYVNFSPFKEGTEFVQCVKELPDEQRAALERRGAKTEAILRRTEATAKKS